MAKRERERDKGQGNRESDYGGGNRERGDKKGGERMREGEKERKGKIE